MKREARVLYSHCANTSSGPLCVGFILRERGIDGIVVAPDCSELCVEASRRGYMGELRFSAGECSCGLPQPPVIEPLWEELRSIVDDIARWVEITRSIVEGKD